MSSFLGLTQKKAGQRTPIKLSGHQQRLKNCKKVFDQLHRTQLHSFIARKSHLQNISSRTPDLAPWKVQDSNHVHTFSQDQEQFRGKSEPKQVADFRKRTASKNVQIIKKMLQISGITKKKNLGPFEPSQSSDNNSKMQIFERNRNYSNQSKGSTKIYRGSRFLSHFGRKDFQQQTIEKKPYFSKKNQNEGGKYSNLSLQTSQKFYEINRQPRIVKNQKSSKKEKSAQKKIINYKSQLLNKTSQQFSALGLGSYIKFINAPVEIKELHIHFNFSAIRKMSSSQAWKSLDIKNGRMIQSLLDSIFKNLQKSEINAQSIKDYCWLYFNNYEKAKLEIILKEHYFKLFAFKLNPIFVYQRISMYFCYLLCDKGLIHNSWHNKKIKMIIFLLKEIYDIILKVVSQIQQTKPTIQNIINATTEHQVEETFQILRSVSEMEKDIKQLQANLNQLIEESPAEEFIQINKTLRQYVKQQIFGIGKRTYENFIKTEMLLSWRYLQVPPTPFLPPVKSQYRYTIVLDLDETIIYYNQDSKILKFRPFLDTFLKKIQTMKFQIISFSASSKSYADAVIEELQRKTRIFQYRLYKDHLSLYQGRLVKDLRRLGRDLSRTLLIDDLNANFSSCKQNGIQISSWHGEKSDRQLLNILSVLTKIQKFQDNLPDEKGGYFDIRDLLKQNRKNLQKMLEVYQSNQFIQEAT